MKNVYLSIDLDFWPDDKKMIRWFMANLQYLKRHEVCVVVDHHKMLPHINEQRCKHMINMDYHSDIVNDQYIAGTDESGNFKVHNRRLPGLNCGTWGNYVEWRNSKGSSFTWLYPVKKCVQREYPGGYCHWGDNPFAVDYATTWGRVGHTQDLSVVEWPRIKAVGIAYSPDYMVMCYGNRESRYGEQSKQMIRAFNELILPQLTVARQTSKIYRV